MRRQVLRSTRRLAQANATQQHQTAAFSTSGRRHAEVELTVDGKTVSIEGMPAVRMQFMETLLTITCSRLGSHPSLREGGLHRPSILLPRETHDCRQLQNVLG